MAFIAEAPGKIIISGEHFVVHGSYALAAAVGRRVRVKATTSQISTIIARNLGLTARLPNNIPKQLEPIAKAVKATLNSLGAESGVKLLIESGIPKSVGLGSSAATAVASVAATAGVLGHTLPKDRIVDLAMESERLSHINPSGVDPYVSTYGGVILYKKGLEPVAIDLEQPINFVVGNSGLTRNTSKMIDVVADRRESCPELFDALVSSSSQLSQLAASSLQKQPNLEMLGAIMNFFHIVLRWVGVSTDMIDRMVKNALRAGALGAKVTGGGGGGSMIALSRNADTQKVLAALERLNVETFLVRLPSEGVRLWKEN